ncbi:hypothetical protein BDR04DRAFT_1231872 [Suillus decipiens]|nr:hypothetical protein BDR04DRAFT_1231872 [Suillus decipiens]
MVPSWPSSFLVVLPGPFLGPPWSSLALHGSFLALYWLSMVLLIGPPPWPSMAPPWPSTGPPLALFLGFSWLLPVPPPWSSSLAFPGGSFALEHERYCHSFTPASPFSMSRYDYQRHSHTFSFDSPS